MGSATITHFTRVGKLMTKISRSAPCPCGSGKKYKKCCLHRDEAQVISQQASLLSSENNTIEALDDLDNLSNSVVDLIGKGKLDEAEQACVELLNRYPDYIDGLERFALVYEARGDSQKAIEYYEKSAEFARKNEGFDPEYVKWAMDKVEKLGG